MLEISSILFLCLLSFDYSVTKELKRVAKIFNREIKAVKQIKKNILFTFSLLFY
jgi:hypothetical protein